MADDDIFEFVEENENNIQPDIIYQSPNRKVIMTEINISDKLEEMNEVFRFESYRDNIIDAESKEQDKDNNKNDDILNEYNNNFTHHNNENFKTSPKSNKELVNPEIEILDDNIINNHETLNQVILINNNIQEITKVNNMKLTDELGDDVFEDVIEDINTNQNEESKEYIGNKLEDIKTENANMDKITNKENSIIDDNINNKNNFIDELIFKENDHNNIENNIPINDEFNLILKNEIKKIDNLSTSNNTGKDFENNQRNITCNKNEDNLDLYEFNGTFKNIQNENSTNEINNLFEIDQNKNLNLNIEILTDNNEEKLIIDDNYKKNVLQNDSEKNFEETNYDNKEDIAIQDCNNSFNKQDIKPNQNEDIKEENNIEEDDFEFNEVKENSSIECNNTQSNKNNIIFDDSSSESENYEKPIVTHDNQDEDVFNFVDEDQNNNQQTKIENNDEFDFVEEENIVTFDNKEIKNDEDLFEFVEEEEDQTKNIQKPNEEVFEFVEEGVEENIENEIVIVKNNEKFLEILTNYKSKMEKKIELSYVEENNIYTSTFISDFYIDSYSDPISIQRFVDNLKNFYITDEINLKIVTIENLLKYSKCYISDNSKKSISETFKSLIKEIPNKTIQRLYYKYIDLKNIYNKTIMISKNKNIKEDNIDDLKILSLENKNENLEDENNTKIAIEINQDLYSIIIDSKLEKNIDKQVHKEEKFEEEKFDEMKMLEFLKTLKKDENEDNIKVVKSSLEVNNDEFEKIINDLPNYKYITSKYVEYPDSLLNI